jgi:uncharacterized membrane protein YfhO
MPIGMVLYPNSTIEITAWGQPCAKIVNTSGPHVMIYIPLALSGGWETFRTRKDTAYAVKPCG